ncbi:hypothetical protein MMC17_003479 [Xylographa soralifera]|nr:hypothetical protein [Xylographa soralifera]
MLELLGLVGSGGAGVWMKQKSPDQAHSQHGGGGKDLQAIPGGSYQEDHTRRTIPGGPYQEDHTRRTIPGGSPARKTIPGGPDTRRTTMPHNDSNLQVGIWGNTSGHLMITTGHIGNASGHLGDYMLASDDYKWTSREIQAASDGYKRASGEQSGIYHNSTQLRQADWDMCMAMRSSEDDSYSHKCALLRQTNWICAWQCAAQRIIATDPTGFITGRPIGDMCMAMRSSEDNSYRYNSTHHW